MSRGLSTPLVINTILLLPSSSETSMPCLEEWRLVQYSLRPIQSTAIPLGDLSSDVRRVCCLNPCIRKMAVMGGNEPGSLQSLLLYSQSVTPKYPDVITAACTEQASSVNQHPLVLLPAFRDPHTHHSHKAKVEENNDITRGSTLPFLQSTTFLKRSEVTLALGKSPITTTR